MSCCRIDKLSVVREFGRNPNCSGLRMLCCSINLFSLDCKIDVNSFPKQLVNVIPRLFAGDHLSPFLLYIGFIPPMFQWVGNVPLSSISLNSFSNEGIG